MKPLFPILLLITVVFQLVGFVPVFKSMQYNVRKEIKRKIKQGVNESELHMFDLNTISKSKEFKWQKIGKEFHYQGTMYDIVRTENGKAYCINDHQEHILFANLENILKEYFSKSNEKKNGMTQLANIFFAEYLPPIQCTFTPNYPTQTKTVFYLKNEYIIASYHASLLRPPAFSSAIA